MSQLTKEQAEKLLAFATAITQQQYNVLAEMQGTDFTGPDPEREARYIFDKALRAGMRSSVIYVIVKEHLTSKGIPFDKQKLNNQREIARQSWENPRTEKFPPPPPLILDPKFFPPKQ